MDYMAIDFETANQYPTSACSIGLVAVTNNKIEFATEYLINPEEEFSDFNINIHHITPEDVEEAGTFPEVWEKIKGYFEGTKIFAHNAGFDLGVLKAMIEKYHLEPPTLKFGCTLKIASKLWPEEMINHRLSTISSYLEMDDHVHHDALSDARVCVEIISRGQRMTCSSSADELYDSLGIRYGCYDRTRYFPTMYRYQRKKAASVGSNPQLNDKVVCVLGKPQKTTRGQLLSRLEQSGAYVEKNINRSLDYVVVLGNCPKMKLMLAAELATQGVPLKFLNEDEILGMLGAK
jgi:DNA polymerase-3 subunit epsilon